MFHKKILQSCKTYIKKKFDLKLKNIRVKQSGCLDKYESGLLMVYYPQGVWYDYKNKTVKEDVPF